MERLGAWIRAGITAAILAIAAWWLFEVASRLGIAPTKGPSGDIIVDPFQQAKDILLVVLPMVTVAFGYWFGVQGKEKAEQKADEATQKVEALTAVATSDVVQQARELYPNAFKNDR